MSKPTVAIWKSLLLPYSETFITTQAEGLRKYHSIYLGLQDAGQVPLPVGRAYLLGERGYRFEVPLFKATGRSPRLTRMLLEKNVSVVHAHFGWEAWRALQISASGGLPVVVTFHGADATMNDDALSASSLSGRQYVQNRAKIFHRVRKVIAVSRFIASELEAVGCPPEKISIHHIGVDSTAFRPRGYERSRDILFVGRLVEKKGVARLIEAMAAMGSLLHRSAVPRLVIVGDGPLRPQLESLARELRVEAVFHGRQSHQFVESQMQVASALVVPSQKAASGESEGLPTVVREAQACGLPVIVSAVAGLVEAVIDRKTGLVAPHGTVEEFAAAMTQILTDPALAGELAARGRIAAEEVDISRQSVALETIYDEARGTARGRI